MKKSIRQFDVVILGAGLAGIYTALNINENYKIGLFVKDVIGKGSSELAQGGIAAELSISEDVLKEHIEDTLKAGSHLNDMNATQTLVYEGKQNIEKLIELGVNFDKDTRGNILLTKEGGHSNRRILHAGGDATGHEMMNALRNTLIERKNITVYEHEMAIEILQYDNVCKGVIVINDHNEEIYVLSSKVIIATGGCGGIYQNTTNDKIATGDGIAMAHRANVQISNMEFVQFHPTSLYEEDKIGQRFLISEAVRGEGAYLRNIEGVRFMEKYSPQLELAPRDIVSQSIYKEMYDTFTDHVYLDIRHKSKEYLEKRFPTIYKKCLESGYAMEYDLIPVSPCEHFLCGGITIDLFGRTSMPGLYAVGEVTNAGVHGANRLASNSLLECIVFGNRIAHDINHSKLELVDVEIPDLEKSFKPFNFKDIRTEVREIMNKYVYIVRKKDGLEYAKKRLSMHYENLKKINVLSKYYYETFNMVTVALIITNAAYDRTESIGSHYRLN